MYNFLDDSQIKFKDLLRYNEMRKRRH